MHPCPTRGRPAIARGSGAERLAHFGKTGSGSKRVLPPPPPPPAPADQGRAQEPSPQLRQVPGPGMEPATFWCHKLALNPPSYTSQSLCAISERCASRRVPRPSPRLRGAPNRRAVSSRHSFLAPSSCSSGACSLPEPCRSAHRGYGRPVDRFSRAIIKAAAIVRRSEKALPSDRESGLVSSHGAITSPLFLRLLPERGPGVPHRGWTPPLTTDERPSSGLGDRARGRSGHVQVGKHTSSVPGRRNSTGVAFCRRRRPPTSPDR